MAKMIYTGRKLVTNLAYYALMKHIELGTSAGAEIGRSVWIVDGYGGWRPDCPGHRGGGQPGRGVMCKEEFIIHFTESFVSSF